MSIFEGVVGRCIHGNNVGHCDRCLDDTAKAITEPLLESLKKAMDAIDLTPWKSHVEQLEREVAELKTKQCPLCSPAHLCAACTALGKERLSEGDRLAELLKEIAELKAENERLRADKERLDWLEAEQQIERRSGEWDEHIKLALTRSKFRQNKPITREAIDKARQQ